MSILKKNKFNFGTAGPTDKIVWAFDFTDKSGVEKINTGCSCTTAKKWDGNIFIGELDLAKAMTYKPGENQVTKTMVIYLNDGEPHWVVNDLLVQLPNPKKGTISVTIEGTVTQ